MFKIAVICGGPSLERGISLNSARSILDHLPNKDIEIHPLYVDQNKNFYSMHPARLYSNTPADFDFKLDNIAKKLNPTELKEFFREINITFPVIHGAFGEDGELQQLLESLGVPFVGPDSSSCKKMFQKHKASELLRENGFPTLPMLVLRKGQENIKEEIDNFFAQHHLKRAIVKPSSGGSSIGVSSVSTSAHAFESCSAIFNKNIDSHAIIEPFCLGSEFTVVVLQNMSGDPIALIPTEVEISYENHEIFDYRKKYLPTNLAIYHTPPRYKDAVIHEILAEAEKLFSLFKMRDFVRMDGWVMPDGTIYFTDFNPISGMEQNSFLFRQASVVGLTHQQVLQYIVKHACKRYRIDFPEVSPDADTQKTPVFVLFGGTNAERQVSLMSGTNVWLKLIKSERFNPTPMLYDPSGHVWKLPYSYALNHTVEEIHANCCSAEIGALKSERFIIAMLHSLGLDHAIPELPKKMSLEQFIEKAQAEKAFVFIAMHGGVGEDGTLQTQLESLGVAYNGSSSHASSLCMDKYVTGQTILKANQPNLQSLIKRILNVSDTLAYSSDQYRQLWSSICKELQSEKLIIKPRADGCSAGIVVLLNANDLEKYCRFIHQKFSFLPPGSFFNQNAPIEMPAGGAVDYILEPYIETDQIAIQKNFLEHKQKSGWLEFTVGVLEESRKYYSLNPSITVAEGSILTLEEKFQGGTGVNITPPPESIISAEAMQAIKGQVEKAAEILGIQNYARIDVFFNRDSHTLVVIEANTLPALTPSTVIFHQALAENPPMTPIVFLEKLIDSGMLARSEEALPSLALSI